MSSVPFLSVWDILVTTSKGYYICCWSLASGSALRRSLKTTQHELCLVHLYSPQTSLSLLSRSELLSQLLVLVYPSDTYVPPPHYTFAELQTTN
jgi:hypothetical protein